MSMVVVIPNSAQTGMSVLQNMRRLKPALALRIGLPPYMSFRSAVALRNPYNDTDDKHLLRDSSVATTWLPRNDIRKYVILRSEATKDLVYCMCGALLTGNEILRSPYGSLRIT